MSRLRQVRRHIAALGPIAFIAIPAAAAPPAYTPPDTAEQAEKIGALEFLAGEWEGSGWTLTAQNAKVEFRQSEEIEFILGRKALTIHGMGRTPDAAPDAAPEFEAFAVVSWDDKADAYRFRSYSSGHVGDFDAELRAPGVFAWRMPSVEFVIDIKGDAWIEKGWRTLPDGKQFQFFEMTLTRAEDD